MTVIVTKQSTLTRATLGLGPLEYSMRPYQYNFNTCDFGAGTPYIVESVKGLLGMSGSPQDTPAGASPGSIPGLLTADSKTIEFTIVVDCRPGKEVEEHLAHLSKIFRMPARGLSTWVGDYDSRGYFTDRATMLSYMRPGWKEPRVIYCRVTKRDIDSDYDLASGFIRINIQLQAPDPLSYGYETTVIQIPSGESIDWEQEGDFPDGYAPFVRLYGNLVNPTVSRTFRNFYFPTGSTQKVRFQTSRKDMTIDMKTRLTNPFGVGLTLTDDNFWVSEPDADQTFSFTGGAGTRADISVRSVWL